MCPYCAHLSAGLTALRCFPVCTVLVLLSHSYTNAVYRDVLYALLLWKKSEAELFYSSLKPTLDQRALFLLKKCLFGINMIMYCDWNYKIIISTRIDLTRVLHHLPQRWGIPKLHWSLVKCSPDSRESCNSNPRFISCTRSHMFIFSLPHSQTLVWRKCSCLIVNMIKLSVRRWRPIQGLSFVTVSQISAM